MVTRKKQVPFNTGSKRFGKLTLHPNLDPNGFYINKPNGCNPCLYKPKQIHDICNTIHSKAIDKDPWRYKKELEEWAQNLGYRNQKILKQRQWNETLLGPAWHELTEPRKYEPICPNIGFGRTSRYARSKDFVPGPGTYYKETPYKAPYGPHSQRQTFEREESCRFKDTSPKWSLAPNRYKICDKESIEEKSNKIVSIRGPYDLFTGKRDDSTIKNHFNKSLKCFSSTWPIALPSTLNRYSKSRFGVMNKTNRDTPYRGRNALTDLSMCIRKGKDPGPAHYNVVKPRLFKKNKYGFNSSYDKAPGYQRVVVWPGVGRYSTVVPHRIEGNGHRQVFLSKIGRTIGAIIPAPLNTF